MWCRVRVAIVASPVVVALIPGSDDGPLGLRTCGLLLPGLCNMFQPCSDAMPCLEATVLAAGSGVKVHLCGVCHVEVGSAAATVAFVERHRPAAVALECEAQTLGRVCAGRRALCGMNRGGVSSEGVGRLRRALHEAPAAHELARQSYTTLPSLWQVGVPPALATHLKRDGVLWSGEMAAAADAALAGGARVVCLGHAMPRLPSHDGGRTGVELGTDAGALSMAACWLRAGGVQPGLNDNSCDADAVLASNTALLELQPRVYEAHVSSQDEHMAARLHALCKELQAARQVAPVGEGCPGSGAEEIPCVVAIVGARHVPGLRGRLLRPPHDLAGAR
eukprot:gene3934-biopygen11292